MHRSPTHHLSRHSLAPSTPSMSAVASINNKRLSTPALSLRQLDEWQQVPLLKAFSSAVPHESLSARNPAWVQVKDTVIRAFQTGAGLNGVGLRLRDICQSVPPQTIFDYFDKKLLKKGFKILRRHAQSHCLEGDDDTCLLDGLESAWMRFHRRLLHELQSEMQPLGIELCVMEKSMMLGFRDHVLLSVNLLDILRQFPDCRSLSPSLRQMLLVLQMHRDAEPPSEGDVALEKMVALSVRPFIGFLGVYDGDEEPQMPANVAELVRHRRLLRSNSRPLGSRAEKQKRSPTVRRETDWERDANEREQDKFKEALETAEDKVAELLTDCSQRPRFSSEPAAF